MEESLNAGPTATAEQNNPGHRVPSDAEVGWSILLAGIATWLTLAGFGIRLHVYYKYYGRSDLDMPDWFAINMGMMFKIGGLMLVAGALNTIAIAMFVDWARRKCWPLRLGFIATWSGSIALMVLLGLSTKPG